MIISNDNCQKKLTKNEKKNEYFIQLQFVFHCKVINYRIINSKNQVIHFC